MASTVAEPLETQFSQINGLSQMTSINTLGASAVTLQFDLNRNIDAASTDVLEAINAAQGQLPKKLPSQPTICKVNPADAPIFILQRSGAGGSRASDATTPSAPHLTRCGCNLMRRLRHGVAARVPDLPCPARRNAARAG